MNNEILDQEYKVAKRKSAKPMLWISMVSMTMMFIGLTSAYIVSSNREDWVLFELPSALYISTALIILSSITFLLAKKSISSDNRTATSVFLILTLFLGIGFVYYQVQGFYELREAGLYLAGKDSVVSASLLIVKVPVGATVSSVMVSLSLSTFPARSRNSDSTNLIPSPVCSVHAASPT